jgi:hypothetical protein
MSILKAHGNGAHPCTSLPPGFCWTICLPAKSCAQSRHAQSLRGTKRKCRNARLFPELGAHQLCYPPASHNRP